MPQTASSAPLRRATAALIALLCGAVPLLGGCGSGDGQRRRASAGSGAPGARDSTPAEGGGSAGWAAGRSTPAADSMYPTYGNRAIDVLHYGLDLTWAKDSQVFTGIATLHLRALADLTTIRLDFSSAYTIDAATVDGVAATATLSDSDLHVPASLKAEQAATLVVKYHGKPTTVPMPSKRADSEGLGLTVARDGTLWTMQEPYGSSTWYPSNDTPWDKALYDIAIAVPAGWSAIASGTPRGRTGDTFRYTSTDPASTYLTTLAVGPYRSETATGPRGLPITYWYRDGDEEMLAHIRRSPQYLAWLEQRFGPYPFPSAGIALVPSLSAMETQQMVTMGNRLRRIPTFIEGVAVHEYAHQWFGDTVTPADWRDLWLSEGWATYVQALYEMERDGTTAADWERQARRTDAAMRASLGPPGSPSPARFAESNVYICPAVMLHEIHKRIGDQAFLALARDWIQRNRNTVRTRADFVTFVNQHTGQDLSTLIATWLDSPTTPA